MNTRNLGGIYRLQIAEVISFGDRFKLGLLTNERKMYCG